MERTLSGAGNTLLVHMVYIKLRAYDVCACVRACASVWPI